MDQGTEYLLRELLKAAQNLSDVMEKTPSTWTPDYCERVRRTAAKTLQQLFYTLRCLVPGLEPTEVSKIALPPEIILAAVSAVTADEKIALMKRAIPVIAAGKVDGAKDTLIKVLDLLMLMNFHVDSGTPQGRKTRVELLLQCIAKIAPALPLPIQRDGELLGYLARRAAKKELVEGLQAQCPELPGLAELLQTELEPDRPDDFMTL